MINVTRPYLPNIERYSQYVAEIYKSGILTNTGPLVQRLEKKLAVYLGVEELVLVANGTIALDVAYKTLGLKNVDAVTTPFSFAATTTSLINSNITPIFADIDTESFNITAKEILKNITSDTKAIVPVHVFGNACEIDLIDDIASKHNLKIVYDAAHAFGVTYKERSILSYGDASTLSFHATKLFHCIEGGAVVFRDRSLARKARELINFGISEGVPAVPGINGKMNEFQAAMGLCLLEDIDIIIKERKKICEAYQNALEGLVQFQHLNPDSTQNYSYYPIVFGNEMILKGVVNSLNSKDIFPRRYFYPSLDTLSYVNAEKHCANSSNIASRILCLPLYYGLREEEQALIITTIQQNLS